MKRIYKCPECKSLMSIETNFEEYLPTNPPCICGKNAMIWLGSPEYAYNSF